MAYRTFLEEDLSCPVCCDIFTDPILLTCTHSICKDCLQKFWSVKKVRECPVCRKNDLGNSFPLNLALKNLCETFQQERCQSKTLCSLHHSEVKQFCQDDNQLLCLMCQDSKLHETHDVWDIHAAAQEHKNALKIKLKPLQNKLDTFKEAKRTYDETAQHIKVQAQNTEWQIKDEFEKLHQFLRDEEATSIAALREEARRKNEMMKVRIDKICREISALSVTIRNIQEEMCADDILFLQTYKDQLERAQCTLQNPERMLAGALISVAKHLANLKFRVWEKMQDIVQWTPVTLDPNTAHPCLTLSEDLTSVRLAEKSQQLPDNPERFDGCLSVLGFVGYNSGTHSWDVEVGDSDVWFLGVKAVSGQRKGKGSLSSGVWGVFHVNGDYTAESPSKPETVLTVQQKLQKIRVHLDWDGGKLSFSNPNNNTCLHTITDTFTERVFPCFITHLSFRILPMRVQGVVKVESRHPLQGTSHN